MRGKKDEFNEALKNIKELKEKIADLSNVEEKKYSIAPPESTKLTAEIKICKFIVMRNNLSNPEPALSEIDKIYAEESTF